MREYNYDVSEAYSYYLETLNLDIVAKKFNTVRAHLIYWFTKNKFKIKRDVCKERIENVKNIGPEKIYEEYRKLFSLNKLSKKYRVPVKFLSEFLYDFELRKYTCNEDFFASDNQRSCYWAGFAAADSCVINNRLQTGLSTVDFSHLEKFKNDLKFTGPIKNSSRIFSINNNKEKEYFTSTLNIPSKKLCKDLEERFNITSRKSLTLKFPERLINSCYVVDFLRGYADGDGSLGKYKKEKFKNWIEQSRLQIVGTKEFLDIFALILNEKASDCNAKVYKLKSSKAYLLTVDGNIKASCAIKFLYQDAEIYLDRKKEIANKIIADFENNKIEKQNKIDNCEEIFLKYKAIIEIKNSNTPKIIERKFGYLAPNQFFFSKNNESAEQFYWAGYLLNRSTYNRGKRIFIPTKDEDLKLNMSSFGVFKSEPLGISTSDWQAVRDLEENFGFHKNKMTTYNFTDYMFNSKYLKYFFKGRLESKGRLVPGDINIHGTLDFVVFLHKFLLDEKIISNPHLIRECKRKKFISYRLIICGEDSRSMCEYFDNLKL